jgi:hypothetical protein
MARWNLGQIMSYATAGVGQRRDIPISIASFIANEAMHQVYAAAPHAWQEKLAISSTTSGENRVFLPNDFMEPISLSYLTDIASSRTLRYERDPARFDSEGFTPVSVPDRYTIYNGWMELHPSPNSAYSLQLRYRSYTTDLIEKTDIPSVSTDWRYAVVLKSRQLLAEWLPDLQLANALRDRYIEHIATLDSDRAKRQGDHSGWGVRVLY